eukprot:m.96802 g.96802  ORF g.96802 m.96802 type:complete len:253 (+) comp12374_c0_seq5:945-1703(+)
MDASTAGGGFTRQGLRRACFQMRFKPDDLPKYLKDHEAVWPEMQTALRETGWHNYSLFYRGDGFAVGFFESDVGFAEACGRMDKTEVNARWQAAMAPYTADNTSPIDQASELEHCLYLGDNRVATLSEAPDGGAADSWHPQAFTGGGGLTATDRRRFAFQTRFDPAQLEALRADLGAMPRDTQQALREAGWHNFSLFLREDGPLCPVIWLIALVLGAHHGSLSPSPAHHPQGLWLGTWKRMPHRSKRLASER